LFQFFSEKIKKNPANLATCGWSKNEQLLLKKRLTGVEADAGAG
jgi:hypothetical protein